MLLVSLPRRRVFNLNLILIKDLHAFSCIGVLPFYILVNCLIIIEVWADIQDRFVGFNIDTVGLVVILLSELSGVFQVHSRLGLIKAYGYLSNSVAIRGRHPAISRQVTS